ncbi:MAG TPA: type 1 glutamine amidotransferase [Actinomycetota bacterium]|nr:type 1 glutamine amidotransferase [Actinomycetota bacterium]
MRPVVLCLEQQRSAPLARLGPLLDEAGLEVRVAEAPAGVDEAQLADCSGVIVLGGEMGCHDAAEFPWLDDEVELIRSAHERELPVLGICLGGQLLVAALGGRVVAGACHEIGWFQSEVVSDDPLLGPPGERTQFLWHSDTFEAPPGAEVLVPGRSPGAAPLAFRSGSSYGLQFHPEVTPELVAAWVADDDHELAELGVDRAELVAITKRQEPDYARQAERMAEGFAGLVRGRAQRAS